MNSQDIENLGDLEEEPKPKEFDEVTEIRKRKVPRGSNGSKPQKDDEILAALKEIAGDGDSGVVIERIGPKSWGGRKVQTGELKRRMAVDEYETGAWHDIYGGGEYRFSRGKSSWTKTIPGAPKEFEEEPPLTPPQGQWVYLPGGQPFWVPPGCPPPPGASSTPPPVMPGAWGGQGYYPPPQQNVAEAVAKAVAEAMKPLAELLAKKDAGADAKLAIEVEKIRADSAREERRSQEVIAKENRLSHEAEVKATQAAQMAFSTSQLEAQKEIARLNAEAQKETARLNAEAVKEAKANDKSMLEQFMTFQQVMGGDKDEDEMDKFDKILRISDRILNRGGEKPLAAEIIAGLPSVIKELKGILPVQPTAPPQQLTGGQQPQPGQPTQPAVPTPTAPSPMAAQFLNAIATANDAILRGFAAARVFPVLKERTPLVVQWVATAEPAALMREVEALTKTAGIDDATKGHMTKFLELGAGDGRAWIEEFFKLARTS